MIGIDWMPDDPVPMTATRLPVKSTGSCGQCAVWYTSPAKVLRPGKSGVNAADSGPVAMTQNRARDDLARVGGHRPAQRLSRRTPPR